MARRVLRDFFLRQPFAAGDILDDDMCRRLEDHTDSLERKGYVTADAPVDALPAWTPAPDPPTPDKSEGAPRRPRVARGG